MTATTDARPERAAEGGRPILRLVPMVAAHPVVFVLTVASILFHQVCSIGAVAVGALVVGQVAAEMPEPEGPDGRGDDAEPERQGEKVLQNTHFEAILRVRGFPINTHSRRNCGAPDE